MEYRVSKAGDDDKQNVFPANHRGRFYCAHCEKFFEGRDQLDYHRYVAHNLRSPLRCSRCQGPFQTSQLLLGHQAGCCPTLSQGSMQNPICLDDYAASGATHQGCHGGDKSTSTQSFMQNPPDIFQARATNKFETPAGKLAQSFLQSYDAVSDGETLMGNLSPAEDTSTDVKKEDPVAQIHDDTYGKASSKTFSEVPIGGGSCLILPIKAAAMSVLHIENTKIMLQALECSEGMEVLPYQLLKKLQAHCRNLQGKLPKFVRPKWRTQVLSFRPSSYGRSIFVDPLQRRGLKAARYAFGDKHQVVFVGARQHDTNERDSWAVVTFERAGPRTSLQGSLTAQQWCTWTIDGQSANVDDTVLRLRFKDEEDGGISNFNGEIADLLDEWCSNVETDDGTDQDRCQSSSTYTNSSTPQPTEDTSDDESVQGSARYPRKLGQVNRSESPGETSEAPQYRDDTVFRESDQAWVRLCCKDCGRKDIKTTRGMMNHCLAKHSRRFKDKHEVADLCGIILRGEEGPPTKPADKVGEGGVATPSSKSPTNPLKRKRDETGKNDPLVVFCNEFDSSKTRVRRFSCCQGIERFFAHAQVAGTADKSTLILSVKVGGGEAIQIIREDEEDFKAVMDAVQHVAEEDNQQIVVTSASLFN